MLRYSLLNTFPCLLFTHFKAFLISIRIILTSNFEQQTTKNQAEVIHIHIGQSYGPIFCATMIDLATSACTLQVMWLDFNWLKWPKRKQNRLKKRTKISHSTGIYSLVAFIMTSSQEMDQASSLMPGACMGWREMMLKSTVLKHWM